jgi:hypothetical protein
MKRASLYGGNQQVECRCYQWHLPLPAKPITPAIIDPTPSHRQQQDRDGAVETAETDGREPALDETPRSAPDKQPTHQVVPDCYRSKVGEVSGRIVGWAMERYST